MAELENPVRRNELATELAEFFVEQLNLKVDESGFIKFDFKDELTEIAQQEEITQNLANFLTEREAIN